MSVIVAQRLIIGMEIHVELATRSKMFTRAANPAGPAELARADGPNAALDPVVLALPGALPVMNARAIELALRVGLALGCRVPGTTRWDRKSYFYPDLPKGYQISQYDHPLCAEGLVEFELPPDDAAGDAPANNAKGANDAANTAAGTVPAGPRLVRVRIARAHLEEDAGKLLHEAPGGGAIDHSIVDLDRAGTPLLEIVTEPDLADADQAEAFARYVRDVCRAVGATRGVMQEGHIRFEPNVNAELTLDDGRRVRTPIVEVKNLNSFAALRGAIEFEARAQGPRWLDDRLEHGPGRKRTCGWDDVRQRTIPQREKEDAHDYRYFPDPDLPPLRIDPAYVQRLRDALPPTPQQARQRYTRTLGLSPKEAAALADEPDDRALFERALDEAAAIGLPPEQAGRFLANLLLQSGARRVNERRAARAGADAAPDHDARAAEAGDPPGPANVPGPDGLAAVSPPAAQLAQLAQLRAQGVLNAAAADRLFGVLADPARAGAVVREVAAELGLLTVRDESALRAWVEAALAEQPQAAADVRAGKDQALGRLVGAVMKHAGGRADGAAVRAALLHALGRA